jgi:D-glycero-D-manno-heptose 1,7-bisphosphate phosphatase
MATAARVPQARRPGPGLINAGIYALDRSIVAGLAERRSLERDVMPGLAALGALRATVADGFFIDIRRAGGFRPRRRIAAGCGAALFLDRDGVLNVDRGWVGSREPFEMDDRGDPGGGAASHGGRVACVRGDQPVGRGAGTVCGRMSAHCMSGCGARSRRGGTIDDVRYCPFHPEGRSRRIGGRATGASRRPGCCWT